MNTMINDKIDMLIDLRTRIENLYDTYDTGISIFEPDTEHNIELDKTIEQLEHEEETVAMEIFNYFVKAMKDYGDVLDAIRFLNNDVEKLRNMLINA